MLAFDPGALLSRRYTLARGPRVRLRLARPGDEPSIRALAAEHGIEPDSLQIGHLLRFDPGRVVICATALVGAGEILVGWGAISLELGAEPEPLLVDERLTDGLAELLSAALSGRAAAITRFRAA
jgi:hypothetical protein